MRNNGKHSKNDIRKKDLKSNSRIENEISELEKIRMNSSRKKEVEKKKSKKHGIKNVILTLLIIFFIAVIIFSGIQLIKWYLGNKANNDIIKEIKESNIISYNENDENVSEVDFEKLKNINSDAVGYIEVPNTNISYPVVQAKNNDYYLTYNFKKEYNSAGWIFMDYRNDLDGNDKNIIIYGHNRRDGSMFGSLKNILSPDWYNNETNKYVTLITEQGNMIYEVFSVYQIEREDYYIQTSFSDNEDYESFIRTITNRSIKNYNVNVSSEDSILTLSTCANDNKYRVVLHAKFVK